MPRSMLFKTAWRSRLFPSIANLDWFALYLTTAAVLFFAMYPLLFLGPSSNAPSAMGKHVTLNDLLTVILSLEVILLVWVWLEMPRRRKAESTLKRMNAVQAAISRASERIVSMKAEELEQGLQKELSTIRGMLDVDRVSWFQQSKDGKRFIRMQMSSGREEAQLSNELTAHELPWILDAILRGEPVRLRRLRDLPPQAEADRLVLERNEVKALALIPSSVGSAGANALALTSVTKEIEWSEEVIAQLSVLASVFASAHARKAAQDAGDASELRFRHLFDDSPIGIALLDSGGKVHLANSALAKLLGRSREQLTLTNIMDVTHPDDAPQTWLDLQELRAGVREITHAEKRFLRSNGSMVWGRMTLSLLGARTGEGALLLGMVEDVTENIQAREQLKRSRRMLTLSLESSRTTAWEYDVKAGTISWLDRKILRDSEDQRPATDTFAHVLSRVVAEDRDSLWSLADKIIETGGNFSTEFRMIAKDGSARWMLGKGELLRKAGEGAKIVGVTVDVSEIKKAQCELQQLAKRLMEAQEEERKRISRELHDDIGQRVALLAIELDIVRQQLSNQDNVRERVERIQESTGELGDDLHQLSHALHSSKLKYLGLEAALRELCGRIAAKHPLLVEFNCGVATHQMLEEEALVLFRVAQESMNNIVRHSRATTANINLEYSETQATLLIIDNGRGFDSDARSGGIGLVGMRERLHAVGGQFQINSSPGRGTEVRASVPLSKGSSVDARQHSVKSWAKTTSRF